MRDCFIDLDNPATDWIECLATALKNGGLITYPNADGYRFAISLHAKSAFEKLCRITRHQPLVRLVCCDLSHIAQYATISNLLIAS